MKTPVLFVRCAAVLALACGFSGKGHAFVVFHVSKTQDTLDFVACTPQTPNACSLRSALIWANQLPGTDTIVLRAGTYPLMLSGDEPLSNPTTRNDLDIVDSVIIRGAGSAKTVIDGSSKMRIFEIIEVEGKDQAVVIEDLTLKGARLEGLHDEGAAILAFGAFPGDADDKDELVVNRVRFTANVMDGSGLVGAALHFRGTEAWILDSEFDHNHVLAKSFSGPDALLSFERSKKVFIQNARIHHNTASGGDPGDLQCLVGFKDVDETFIDRSELSDNWSRELVCAWTWSTAGINDDLLFLNTTFSGNGGTAILNDNDLQLVNVTITNNNKQLSPGLPAVRNRLWGTLSIKNSIIAKQASGTDCGFSKPGTVQSLGNNIDSDGSCELNSPSDLPGMDPKLGLLQDNGGISRTHMPAASSPAVNSGENLPGLSADQRGFARPIGPSSDIGAVERNILTPVPPPDEER